MPQDEDRHRGQNDREQNRASDGRRTWHLGRRFRVAAAAVALRRADQNAGSRVAAERAGVTCGQPVAFDAAFTLATARSAGLPDRRCDGDNRENRHRNEKRQLHVDPPSYLLLASNIPPNLLPELHDEVERLDE